jgi:hypothetical protein
MGKRSEYHFFREDIQMVNKGNNLLNINNYLENANQSHSEIPFHSDEENYNKKDKKKCWFGCTGIRTLIHRWWKYTPLENSLAVT